jgi:hypothetical protein
LGCRTRGATRFHDRKEPRNALQATDIREVLADRDTLQVSAIQFDALHRRWCSRICSSLAQSGIKNPPYGRAAKLVAVYLKATIIMGGASCDSPLGRNLHPPIDRILLQGLASSRIESPHRAAWRLIDWTQLDESGYYKLIGSTSGCNTAGCAVLDHRGILGTVGF